VRICTPTLNWVVDEKLNPTSFFPCSAEMRHKVTQGSFIFRKTLDNLLYSLTSPEVASLSHLVPTLSKQPYSPGNPKGWLPLYTMVTFRPDINYATARAKAMRQTAILTRTIRIGVAALGAAAGWLAWAARNRTLD
jgi:kynurenine 3-monooxygenase